MNTEDKHLCDLTILIPALREAQNLEILIPEIEKILKETGIKHEILIVTISSDLETKELAQKYNINVLEQVERGYGGALIKGFETAKGEYIVTMDADLSHSPLFIKDLWNNRLNGDVVISSRYVKGGKAHMPLNRYLLSKILNFFFKRGLSLPVSDISSGFRLYSVKTLKGLSFNARDFNILPEILVRVITEGWKIKEVPFVYTPRIHGSSNARVFLFGIAYLKTFYTLWGLRNSIMSSDYDDRAYDSIHPLQAYWQRKRFRHITDLFSGCGEVLDVGCGSSRIISMLPAGSVAMDILFKKLTYSKRFGKTLIQASGNFLPFKNSSFPCVLCSQVIEHVKGPEILYELIRVLKPGGRLIIGTPDYSRWEWRLIEKLYKFFAPNAYADEHITRYTQKQLLNFFTNKGFIHEESRYIMRGELIMAFTKN